MANPKTAFEAITTRQSWYASEEIAKYDLVEMGISGKYQKAAGTGYFAGVCEYGCEAADRMVTIVKGTYPVCVSEDVKAGDTLIIDTGNPGKAAKGTSGVIGVALNDAAAGELTSLNILEAGIASAKTASYSAVWSDSSPANGKITALTMQGTVAQALGLEAGDYAVKVSTADDTEHTGKSIATIQVGEVVFTADNQSDGATSVTLTDANSNEIAATFGAGVIANGTPVAETAAGKITVTITIS